MTKDEALQLLDNAVSQLQTTRQVHVQLQQAIQVLKEAIKEPKVKDETK